MDKFLGGDMSEMTPTERSALVAYHLTRGMKLSARDVSKLTGIKVRSARKLLYAMSRVIPVAEEGGRFMCLGVSNTEEDEWTTS